MTKSTGIFFHYQAGRRLKDFPSALNGILDKDNVIYYDALYPSKPDTTFDIPPISLSTLKDVHAPEMVDRVKQTGEFEGAMYSAAGTVTAAKKIWTKQITNAFVFTGYGDHHAGGNFFGGGCYINGAAIAIHELRKEFDVKRFSIIDTDAHHGDGTWSLFENDPDVLNICFCSGPLEDTNHNINIHVPFQTSDSSYLELAEKVFEQSVKPFKPEIIFWNWGYDGTIGDYGDMGLTPEFHLKMCHKIKKLADSTCAGQLIVVLCGGSRRDLACYLIPNIIKVIAEI